MKLWQTRRHWEKFARTDPMWAVLAHEDKTGNRWKPADFFATGRTTIDAEIARVRACYPELQRGRALDFGCGIGRLSQALAVHFDEVTGIDISAGMIALAQQYNSAGPRVTYLHNHQPDLTLLGETRFDFVYSLITLQHIAPDYAQRYIGEFVRVLAPGGAVFFQIPAASRVPPRPAPSGPTKLLWHLLNRSLAMEPVMQMHTLPRETVLATLRAAGAEVLEVFRYDAAGTEFESYGYLARKPQG